MQRQLLLTITLVALAGAAQALDLDALWDFRNPALSERRFREALTAAEPQLAGAGAEARCRQALEFGRSLASATHRPEQRTPQSDAAARAAYERALAIAREARLDGLKRHDEALAIQQRLEHENEAAGTPDRYVFEELELLHGARGEAERAGHDAARRKAAGG